MAENRVRGVRLEPYEYAVRTPEQFRLFEKVVVNQLTVPYVSKAFDTFSFRHFTLYLQITSTGTGTHELCFVPEFAVMDKGSWHRYVQGLFAALCYEDTDTATVVNEAFSGDCDGRFFRLEILPTLCTGSNYFTVSAWAEFWS